jgi:hypothetical protein
MRNENITAMIAILFRWQYGAYYLKNELDSNDELALERAGFSLVFSVKWNLNPPVYNRWI